eukprot:18289_3
MSCRLLLLFLTPKAYLHRRKELEHLKRPPERLASYPSQRLFLTPAQGIRKKKRKRHKVEMMRMIHRRLSSRTRMYLFQTSY